MPNMGNNHSNPSGSNQIDFGDLSKKLSNSGISTPNLFGKNINLPGLGGNDYAKHTFNHPKRKK